jgi:D-sedoheptulose 7-phosphate isomerase
MSASELATHLERLGQRLEMLRSDSVEPMATAIESAWRRNASIFVAGNGGNAATALHFAADLCKTTLSGHDSSPRIKAVSLSANVSLLTAWSNDASFDQVFSEQLRNLASGGDLVILMSTSGGSSNLLATAVVAQDIGVHSLAIAPQGSALSGMVDITVGVEAETPQIAEDLHLAICHAVTTYMQAVLAAG